MKTIRARIEPVQTDPLPKTKRLRVLKLVDERGDDLTEVIEEDQTFSDVEELSNFLTIRLAREVRVDAR